MWSDIQKTYETNEENRQPHTGTAMSSGILKTYETDKENGQLHTGTAKRSDYTENV
jgi:hypothetical protein